MSSWSKLFTAVGLLLLLGFGLCGTDAVRAHFTQPGQISGLSVVGFALVLGAGLTFVIGALLVTFMQYLSRSKD